MQQIHSAIYHIEFSTQLDLCYTLFRLIEGPDQKFEDLVWNEAISNKGRFRYFESWGGFCVPDPLIRTFLAHKSKLITREKWFWRELSGIRRRKFCLVATCRNHNALDHELFHAFYYLDKHFRTITENLLCNILIHHPIIWNRAIRAMNFYPEEVRSEEVACRLGQRNERGRKELEMSKSSYSYLSLPFHKLLEEKTNGKKLL